MEGGERRHVMLNRDIPRLVEKVVDEYGGDSPSAREIARSAGFKVIRDSDVHDLHPGEYGALYRIKGQWYIIYDDSLPEEKNFTIAHELGHAFLKHNEENDKFLKHIEEIKKKHSRRVERQADLFARCLLETCAAVGLE